MLECENQVLDDFDIMIAKHFTAYPPCRPTDYIKDKSSLDIVISKDSISKGVREMKTSRSRLMPYLSMTFTKDSVNEHHPLGTIYKYESVTSLSDDDVTFTTCIDDTEISDAMLKPLEEDWSKLQEGKSLLNQKYCFSFGLSI